MPAIGQCNRFYGSASFPFARKGGEAKDPFGRELAVQSSPEKEFMSKEVLPTGKVSKCPANG